MGIEKNSECLLCEGSASVCFLCRPLIGTCFTFIALFVVDVSVFHEVGVLTSWTTHLCLLAGLWIYRKDSVSVLFVKKKNQTDFFLDLIFRFMIDFIVVWTIHVAFQVRSQRLKEFYLVFHLPENMPKNKSHWECAIGEQHILQKTVQMIVDFMIT